MNREIEAKILNIDPKAIQEKLEELGAKLIQEVDLEQVYWLIPNSQKSVRVRRINSLGSTRLTLKDKAKDGFGYHEWETEIGDFDTAVSMLDTLFPEFDLRLEYSHKRQDWELDGAKVFINWYPKLSPLIEIETTSREKLYETAKKLGFHPDELVDKGAVSLLREKLDLKQGSRVKLE